MKIDIKDLHTFDGRASNLYYIRTKDSLSSPFRINEAQKLVWKTVQNEWERTKKQYGFEQCKIMILKGRQMGMTTLFTAVNQDEMLLNDYTNVLILAHDDPSSERIFREKYKFMYNRLPEYVDVYDGNKFLGKQKIKPETEANNGKNLIYSEQPYSSVYVQTAGGGDNVGKGSTINSFHATECANYVHFNDVLASVEQMIPMNTKTLSVLETTANGMQGIGEPFYEMWVRSQRNWERYIKGQIPSFDDYRPIFIPYYATTEYRMNLINGQLISTDDIDFVNNDLKKLFFEREEYVLEEVFKHDRNEGMRAIQWYRWCIKKNCQSNILTAFRYYPILDIDAFTATTQSFFNSTKLVALKDEFVTKGENKKQVGYLNEELEFVEDQFGSLIVWEHPDDEWMNRYIVSVDETTGNSQEGGDSAVIAVFDRLNQDFVARYRAEVKEDQLAEEAIKIGLYYNYAYMIPESNMTTVVNVIKPDGFMPYEGEIFYQGFDMDSTPKWGFRTNGTNKRELMEMYASWLKDKYRSLKDIEEVEEHLNFVKKKSKSGQPMYQAADKHHDDIVLARALCIYADTYWDEDVAKLNEKKNDITEFHRPQHFRGYKTLQMKNFRKK